jgi:hypothetical protein
MTGKLYRNLLLFSLFGIAMWFFGNLYEGIVIGPNMLENSVQRLRSWQDFFVTTNPIFFYVPISQLATITLLILFFRTPKQETELNRQLKLASIFLVSSMVLSVYIITQVNFKLFFGNIEKYSDQVQSKAILWNILNLFRVVLVAISLTFVFKAYIQTQQKAK